MDGFLVAYLAVWIAIAGAIALAAAFWSAARAIALVVAAGSAAIAVALAVHWRSTYAEGIHDMTWLTALAVVATLGAASFLVGTIDWYGRRAMWLRLAGFVLLVAAAALNVSFTFVLLPFALLGAFSLPEQRADSGGRAPG